MPYTLTQHITPKKQQPFRALLNVVIVVIAIPVVVIAWMCLLLYFAFLWVKNLGSTSEPDNEPYHQELALLANEQLTITMTEDELDTELTQLNEDWMANVYNEETCLYRVTTVPQIAALHGKICCFYLKEMPDGVILQVLQSVVMNKLPDTQLVFLHYQTLQVTVLAETPPFYLYNEKDNPAIIKGFNQKQNIVIEIKS